MIDGIIVIIVLIFAVVGYNRGLVQSLITLVSSVLAIGLALVVYPAMNMMLKVLPIYTSIYTGVFEKIEAIKFGKGLQSQEAAITQNIDWLPRFLVEQIANNNNSNMYEILGVNTIQEYVSTYITNMIINLLAILITWVLVKIVLVWVLRAIGIIVEHLPIVSNFNHLGGFFVGIFKGLLTFSVIALLMPIFMTMPRLESWGAVIETSYIMQWMYTHNIIISIYNTIVTSRSL